MRIVSISGRDGVGKSQQVSLFGGDEALHITGGLGEYGDKWPKLNPAEHFNWWFRDLPFLELVSIILESLRNRRIAHDPKKINVNDRGSIMFKAVCASTLATRSETSFEDAIKVVDGLFEEELRESASEQEVLLKADLEYTDSVRHLVQIVDPRSSKFLPWQTEMYAQYQGWLTRFVEYYFRGSSPLKIICVDSCILDTQNKLRSVINEVCSAELHPFCSTLSRLVAFGGLSESGKSCFAQRLSTHHQFHRLKIKYFGKVVQRCGLEINPVNLGRELLTFLDAHKHIARASIESLHGVDLPAYLKLLFGPRLKIVFLDTPEEVRVRRTAQELGISEDESRSRIATKDAVKLSRGADRIKNIADAVFSNGDDDFETSFRAFVSQI